MITGWKMRVVEVVFTEKVKRMDLVRLLFRMECGHVRRYGSANRSMTISLVDEYGPGHKDVGDKARCYECGRLSKPCEPFDNGRDWGKR